MIEIGRWFVGFYGADRRYLWDWLSPRGWQHVTAFAYHTPSERWLIYDVALTSTGISAATSEQFAEWLAVMKSQGMRTLAVDMPEDYGRPMAWGRLWFYCVPAVKHLICAKSRALRPIGLWRDLIKSGAKEAFT